MNITRNNSTGAQAPASGSVAGTVLRGARTSAGITEACLAATAHVSEDTIRSWENGSSPLADVPYPQIKALDAALREAGADHAVVADLDAAAWCDLVIHAVLSGDNTACLLADPMADEDSFRELLAWSLAGQVPDRYQPYVPGEAAMGAFALAGAVAQLLESVNPALRGLAA